MGIIRESLAKANAKAKKVVYVKKEEKAPIVFENGDDSVEPIDNGAHGVAAGSAAQITGENFSKLMEAFISAEKFGRDGKISHAVSAALEDISSENCTPEAVGEALRAAGLGFLADAFVRVCNGDDIDTIVSETVVGAEDDVEIHDTAPAEEEPATDAAPETTEKAPAEETAEEAVGNAAPADNTEAAEAPEKKKPGRPKNSDKK